MRFLACSDEALLLLIHKELPWTTRLSQQLHLWTCSRCRLRLGQYAALSSQLATTLTRPGRRPRICQPALKAPASMGVVSGLLLIILCSLGVFLVQWHAENPLSYRTAPSESLSQDLDCLHLSRPK
jgi:hypothetical protein